MFFFQKKEKKKKEVSLEKVDWECVLSVIQKTICGKPDSTRDDIGLGSIFRSTALS